jgi:RNA polymerase sigma factor (sigma-70 family)
MGNIVSESDLLQASLAGSKEAFGTLVQRYQSLVCAVTYSATGDIGRSEELAQETFVRAWQNLRQLESPDNFRAWLCTIARNLVSRSIRDKRKDVTHGADSLERAETLAAPAPEPDQVAIDKELQGIVWAAVGGMPQIYREPLVLFYREQQSVRQVAADMGLSEETVRQRLHQGRKFIRAELASLVEDTLARSGPSEAFAIAVVAALPALVTPTASAAVAGIAAKGTPAAQTLWTAGFSGAILGPIFAILGSILGAWYGVRSTPASRGRRFLIWMTLYAWLLGLVVLGVPLAFALVGLVPWWAWWLSTAVFLILLLPLIVWSSARQRRILVEDGTCPPGEHQPARITRPAVYGSFGGSIFGATLWLLILAVLARDWVSFGVLLGGDVLLFLLATALCVRRPQSYWSVAFGTACALMVMTLAAVNLRWTVWRHALRESPAYNPTNEVSLTTINLMVLSVFVTVLAVFTTQYLWRRAARKGQTRKGRKPG